MDTPDDLSIPQQLAALQRDLASVVTRFEVAITALASQAAEVGDFAGVQRLGRGTLVVDSVVLRARGQGAWDIGRVDAPAQAAQLCSLARLALLEPAATQRRLSDLLRAGRCELAAGAKFHADPEILTLFRPALEAVAQLAATALDLQRPPASPGTEARRGQGRRASRP